MSVVAKPVSTAERAKLARSRRKNGLRVFPVELRDSEVARLVQLGWLAESKVSDRDAVGFALGCMVEAMPDQAWPRRS